MAPKELEGNTLGEKHRQYNKLVTEAITKNAPLECGDLNAGENDIENLINIDIACKVRNLEYVLKVLKCDDILYVSRAIKLSKWLVTDRQYSHIINPNYLHSDLLPQMTFKASAKLMLHIRLNLKDEDRVEDFYKFSKERYDIKTALKWLPHCPLSLIEQEVVKHHDEIDKQIFKRLCERSITVLEKYVKHSGYGYYKSEKIKLAMFLLTTDTEKFLDIYERLDAYEKPQFGAKYTEKLMRTSPQRIIEKFDSYAEKVDVSTFAKHLKKDELKDFLTKQSGNKKLRCWFNDYNNVKHFARYMPKEGRFDFLKKLFIDKTEDKNDNDMMESDCAFSYRCGIVRPPSNSANIYRWYYFAPFEVAFPDLIKLIRTESSPTERIAMFSVLLSCAKSNRQHLQTLLQYYHDKHINEPFKFKIQIVNMFIAKTDTHKYDEKCWNLLNNLFHSMEVYFETENNVQCCVQAIIAYQILHGLKVPEIIEKKFVFNSMNSLQKKLNVNDGTKIFNYLYGLIVAKINKRNISSENDLIETISLVKELATLLNDWKMGLNDLVHEKIKELLEIKVKNCWKTSLASFYNDNKSWRRRMFEESLRLAPSDRTIYNSLKHDPELLTRSNNEVKELRFDDSMFLCRVLRTLRVYWAESLATQWSDVYVASLKQPSGHKAKTRGLFMLLPPKQVVDIVKQYAPTESKINWSEEDEIVLSIRKQLARNMHVTRPHLSPEIILLYAKGDYLQFSMPSLSAIMHNMSSERTYKHIKTLLDAPVSLQKHGIRFAFSKLDSDKLKSLFYDIWKNTKNASIRAVLFQQTYQILCREKKEVLLEEIWVLLSMFIDSLTHEENKVIYETLGKVNKVPLLLEVRGKFLMKSYTFLKSLPAKANCESILKKVKNNVTEVMDQLDPDFVAELLTESLDKKFTTASYGDSDIMATYLLCTKVENVQQERYKKLLLPLLDRSFALWNSKFEVSEWGGSVRQNVIELLKSLSKLLPKLVFKMEMVFPVKLFTEILNQFEQRLPIESNYVTLRTWKLMTTFVKLADEHKDLLSSIKAKGIEEKDNNYPQDDELWNDLYLKIVPEFAKKCSIYLKEDIEKYFQSIYILFGEAYKKFFVFIHELVDLKCLQYIVENDNSVEAHLMALNALGQYYNHEDEKTKIVKKIRDKIHSHPSSEVKFHYYRKYKVHDS